MSQIAAAKGCGLVFSKTAEVATKVPRPVSLQSKLEGTPKLAAVIESKSVAGSVINAISPNPAVGVMVLGDRLKKVVERTSLVVNVDAP